ncbi:MAG: SIS domain-containing protein [Myxococcales bacterium]|nr:SIS domain-containing protein [Myxococcales bacterium]
MAKAASVLKREIFSQPQVLQRILRQERKRVEVVARRIAERDPKVVVIVGRGSADNAGIYSKYLFGALNKKLVALATPSLITRYGAKPDMSDALVVAISQSGASQDVAAVVETARAQGGLTLAITNTPGSPLAQAAEEVLLCHAGEERSVAATKTYTAQLLLVALLSAHLEGNKQRLASVERVPELVERALDIEPDVERVAERLRYLEHCAVVGRGFCYGTTFEIALKLKELTYIIAQPYSSADFRHGPMAIVAPGFCVLVLAPQGKVMDDVEELCAQLAERKAEVITVSDKASLLRSSTVGLALPRNVPEWLSPLTCVVPGQLLALHLAAVKGLPIDTPRGLSKVTVTR